MPFGTQVIDTFIDHTARPAVPHETLAGAHRYAKDFSERVRCEVVVLGEQLEKLDAYADGVSLKNGAHAPPAKRSR